MADSKITALTALTDASSDDLLPIVDDPAGTPVTKKITVANFKKAVAFRAYITSDHNFTADDFTKINFDAETYDYGSNFDTSNKRFVAPQDGVYFFNVSVAVTGISGADELELWVKKNNGTPYLNRNKIASSIAAPRADHKISFSAALATSDYIEIFALTVGACTGTGGTRESWWEGFLVGTY